jgi:CheY-like chemotaxis protein
MDHMMPEMNGVEATARIRELPDGEFGADYFKTLPIVALTANAVSGMREMFLENGMNDFIAKPIETPKLEEALKKWLPSDKVKKALPPQPKSAKSTEVSGESTPFMSAMDKIGGISSARAFTYAGGSPELLETNVQTITGLLPDSVKKLNGLIESDLSLFAIQVHGVKNMLANIGAELLTESAQELENLAKAEERESCVELYRHFEEDITRLIKKLQKLTAADSKPKIEGDNTLLLAMVEKIEKAAELFDSALALEIIASLTKEFSYGDELDGRLQKLTTAFECFDFDTAEELINLIKQ